MPYRQAGRQRPRRGRPDRRGDFGRGIEVDTEHRRQRLRIARGVGHVDRRRLLVVVFDLGFGQRRTAIEAPVHRLHPAREVAAFDDLRQRTQDVGLVGQVHGAIGIVPVGNHAQALEVGALQVDLRAGVFATLRAELGCSEFVADLAELLFHHQLDRQAVAIPARHERRVVAGHQARLDHRILEHLVDRMAEVDRTVRVRRAVMEHPLRPAFRLRADPCIQPFGFPARERDRFALGQVAAHREIGGRQVDRGLVAVAVLFAHA